MSLLSGTSARTGALRTLILGLAAVGCLAIAALALVTVTDVVGRQFGHPVPGAYDLVRLLGAVAMACALPLTKAVKGHIAIEFFFQKMNRRGRAATDTLMRLALLFLFGALTWEFVRQGRIFQASGEQTPPMHLPVFWVFWVLALACGLTACVTLWHLLHPSRSMMRPGRE